jgi:hypothetical protein
MSDKPSVTAQGPDIADVIACVRKHGFDPPSDPVAFKQWMAREETSDSDLHAALVDCKLAMDPGPKPGAGKPPADCGGPAPDKPAEPAPDKPAGKPDDGGSV